MSLPATTPSGSLSASGSGFGFAPAGIFAAGGVAGGAGFSAICCLSSLPAFSTFTTLRSGSSRGGSASASLGAAPPFCLTATRGRALASTPVNSHGSSIGGGGGASSTGFHSKRRQPCVPSTRSSAAGAFGSGPK
jgi:hypothetical protein